MQKGTIKKRLVELRKFKYSIVDFLLDLIILYKFIVFNVSLKEDGTQLSHTDMIGINTIPFETTQADVNQFYYLYF